MSRITRDDILNNPRARELANGILYSLDQVRLYELDLLLKSKRLEEFAAECRGAMNVPGCNPDNIRAELKIKEDSAKKIIDNAKEEIKRYEKFYKNAKKAFIKIFPDTAKKNMRDLFNELGITRDVLKGFSSLAIVACSVFLLSQFFGSGKREA